MTSEQKGVDVLSEPAIERGWRETFSTQNPFCPCDLKSFGKAARWAGRAISAAEANGDTKLAAIGELIRTQDNRITDQPIFIVQQKRRIAGLTEDYAMGYGKPTTPSTHSGVTQ